MTKKFQSSVIKVALLGNPNAGKSTIFNNLTQTHEFTGNWSGSTVEKVTGSFIENGSHVEVVDLPGLYSLASTFNKTIDQDIALNFLNDGQYDFIVNVVDATNLTRHLYLTMQLLEAGIPMLLVVNMIDKSSKQRIQINLNELSKLLGIKVIGICAKKNQDINSFRASIIHFSKQRLNKCIALNYDTPKIIKKLVSAAKLTNRYPNLQAIQLLEGESDAKKHSLDDIQLRSLQKSKAELKQKYDENPALIFASFRYEMIQKILQKVTTYPKESTNFSDKLDSLFLNKYLGYICLSLFLYLMFTISIVIGGIFQQPFELISEAIFKDGIAQILHLIDTPLWLVDIVAYGIGGGIATVIMFVPIIGSLYLLQAFLEDSGYMARASVLLDRFFKKLSLPGNAFIPLIMGFGCNVPAILSTRLLKNPKERITTILMTPFMSCSGRLSVYALFCSVFFIDNAHNIVFALYLTGILIAIITAKVMSYALGSNHSSLLVMELPTYHLPSFANIFSKAFYRLKGFIINAGKLIVIVYLILHMVSSVGIDGSFGNRDKELSLLSVVSKKLTFIFHPIGIKEDNWPATVGIFTGILAKEVVVGTLNALYDEKGFVDGGDTSYDKISQGLKLIGNNFISIFNSSLVHDSVMKEEKVKIYSQFLGSIGAFSYLLFILLYFPCVSVFAVISQELNLSWAFLSVIYSTLLAYFIAMLFFQAASFYAGLPFMGSYLIIAIIGIILVYAGFVLAVRMIDARH